MPYGDVGGPSTQLVVTMRTPATGDVDIREGDALCLTGAPWEVSNVPRWLTCNVFGQAVCDCSENGHPIPVRVRGVMVFKKHLGGCWAVGNAVKMAGHNAPGKVRMNYYGTGTVLAITDTEVYVLL